MGNRLDRGLRLGLAAAAIAAGAYGLSGRAADSQQSYKTLLPLVASNSEPLSRLPTQLPPYIQFLPETAQTMPADRESRITVTLTKGRILILTGQFFRVNDMWYDAPFNSEEAGVFAIGADDDVATTLQIRTLQGQAWLAQEQTLRTNATEILEDIQTAGRVQVTHMAQPPNCPRQDGCNRIFLKTSVVHNGNLRAVQDIYYETGDPNQSPLPHPTATATPAIQRIPAGEARTVSTNSIVVGDVEPDDRQKWHDSDPNTGLITDVQQTVTIRFPFAGEIFTTESASDRQTYAQQRTSQLKQNGCVTGCARVDVLPYPGKGQGE